MKIRYKIMASLLSVVALLIAVTVIAYRDSMAVDYYRKQSIAIEAQLVAFTNLRAQVRNQLLVTYEVGFVENLQGRKNHIKKEKEQVQIKFAELEKVLQADANSNVLQVLHSEYSIVDSGLDKALQLAQKGHLAAAKTAILDVRKNKFNQGFIKKISEFIDNQKVKSKEGSKNLELSISRLQNMLIMLTVLAIVLAGALVVFISKSIGDRLARLEEATRKISGGEFNVVLPMKGSDELSVLSKAFNQMASALLEARNKLTQQQALITQSSKMSALGEMAGGIAHEINTPLAVIGMRAEQMEECVKEGDLEGIDFMNGLDVIKKTVDRIAKIISGLQFFARESSHALPQKVKLSTIIQETLSFCRERFANHGVQFDLIESDAYQTAEIECRSVEISQVLLNLLNNAYDAIESSKDKWIRLDVLDKEKYIEITITDSGQGIPEHLQDKIMQPFFTTKDIGKGTGLGLSISKGIVEQHGGQLLLDKASPNTCFIILLPKTQKSFKFPQSTGKKLKSQKPIGIQTQGSIAAPF